LVVGRGQVERRGWRRWLRRRRRGLDVWGEGGLDG